MRIARLTLLTALPASPAWAQDENDSGDEESVDPAEKAALMEEHADEEEATEEADEPEAVDPDEKAATKAAKGKVELEEEVEEEPVAAPVDRPKKKEGLAAAESFETPTPKLRAWVRGGGGFMSTTDLDGHGAGTVTVGATYGVAGMLRFGAQFTGGFYAQDYVSTTPALEGGGNQYFSEPEKLQDLQIQAYFDLMEVLPVGWFADHIRTEISLSPRYLHLDNPLFGNWSGSLRGGLDVVFYPADGLHFDAGCATSPRLFGRSDTLSVAGLPKWFNDYHAGVGLDFGEDLRWELGLGWKADTFVFEHATRNLHQAQVGLAFAW